MSFAVSSKLRSDAPAARPYTLCSASIILPAGFRRRCACSVSDSGASTVVCFSIRLQQHNVPRIASATTNVNTEIATAAMSSPRSGVDSAMPPSHTRGDSVGVVVVVAAGAAVVVAAVVVGPAPPSPHMSVVPK